MGKARSRIDDTFNEMWFYKSSRSAVALTDPDYHTDSSLTYTQRERGQMGFPRCQNLNGNIRPLSRSKVSPQQARSCHSMLVMVQFRSNHQSADGANTEPVLQRHAYSPFVPAHIYGPRVFIGRYPVHTAF